MNKTQGQLVADIVALRTMISRYRELGYTGTMNWEIDKHKWMLITMNNPIATHLTENDELPTLWWAWAKNNLEPDFSTELLGYREDWLKVPTGRYLTDGFRYFVPSTSEPNLNRTLLHWTFEGVEMAAFASTKYQRRIAADGKPASHWYKVVDIPYPSQSASIKAARRWLVGLLIGRTVTSTKQCIVGEVEALMRWLLPHSIGVGGRVEYDDHVTGDAGRCLSLLVKSQEFRNMVRIEPTGWDSDG